MTAITAPQTAPVETVTPIRPSEAIRLGCLLAPVQAFVGYGAGDTACALGALVLGYGEDEYSRALGSESSSPKSWAAVTSTIGMPCPVDASDFDTGDPFARLYGLIPHLNDDHRWSRERIADWLEGLGL